MPSGPIQETANSNNLSQNTRSRILRPDLWAKSLLFCAIAFATVLIAFKTDFLKATGPGGSLQLGRETKEVAVTASNTTGKEVSGAPQNYRIFEAQCQKGFTAVGGRCHVLASGGDIQNIGSYNENGIWSYRCTWKGVPTETVSTPKEKMFRADVIAICLPSKSE